MVESSDAWGRHRGGRHPGYPAILGPLVVTAGVVQLRPPKLFDAAQWSKLRRRDRDYLRQWEPGSSGDWEDRHAAAAWPAQWSALRGLGRRGHGLPFVIMVDGEFAGQLTVGNVVRGSLCSAWVGYWVASDRAGGGVATAAVALAVDHCFAEAGLHRLEATVRPENERSIRVLTKVGFRREGLFQRYLEVAGAWRDHLCFAVTAEDVAGGVARRLIADGHAGLP